MPQGDDRRSFGIGNAATDKLKKSKLTHAGILEIRKRGPGQDGLTRSMPVSSLENNTVRKAGETHRFSFACPQAKDIELGELENGRLGHASFQEIADIFASMKFFIAAASEAYEGNATIVRKTGVLRLNDFIDFSRVKIRRPESLDGGVTHPHTVKDGRVDGFDPLTAEDAEEKKKK